MKMEDIRGLTPEELKEKINDLKKNLMNLRFQAKTGKLEQQTRVRQVRRDIARLLTVMNEKRAGVKA
jgi:large subunit ribosomal protein L29